MLERLLSRGGFRVYLAVALPLIGWVFWGMLTDRGPVAWVNEAQAGLFGGRSYLELTAILFLVPILLIAFPAGFFYDYLTGQGVFSPKESPPAPTEGGA
jgi:hypothetical protein